jgi:hypothetical protein
MNSRNDSGRSNGVGAVRRKLAQYMREQAACRVAQAEREPLSAVNHRRSANASEAWARYVEALPDDDPSLVAIADGQALIGSPPEFRPRGDGGSMIRGHGYPNTIAWDEGSRTLGPSPEWATPEPAPNATLMRELALLERPPGPPGEEAWAV